MHWEVVWNPEAAKDAGCSPISAAWNKKSKKVNGVRYVKLLVFFFPLFFLLFSFKYIFFHEVIKKSYLPHPLTNKNPWCIMTTVQLIGSGGHMATQRRRKRKVGPLTTLTPKQETFALNIHAGMTNKDAYLDAYDIKNASLNTIYQNSSKLLKNPKIVMRLNQLEEESIRVTKVSLRKHLERLNELGQGAESAQQFAAAINAELNRGKASGLYINRQEIFGSVPVDCSIKVSFGDDEDEPEEDDLAELE